MTIKNVELTKKANVYFEGKVTSRSFVDENGVKKLLLKTTDLSEMLLSDAYIVLRTHRHSVADYLGMTEQLTQFNLKSSK